MTKELILSLSFYIPVGAIDTVTTEYTLSRCQNCREGNPFLQSQSTRIISKTLISTGLAIADTKIKSRKTRRIIKISYLLLNIGVGAWNLHHARR